MKQLHYQKYNYFYIRVASADCPPLHRIYATLLLKLCTPNFGRPSWQYRRAWWEWSPVRWSLSPTC